MKKYIPWFLLLTLAYMAYFYIYYLGNLVSFSNDFQVLSQSTITGLASGKFYSSHANLNTPFFNSVFTSIVKLTWPANFNVWSVISLSSLIIALHLIIQQLKLSHPLIFFSLMWFSMPALSNVILVQTGFVAALFCVLLWQQSRNYHEKSAGILLGIVVSFKLFFGLFIVLFLSQKRWKLLFISGITFLLLNARVISFYGLSSYKDYAHLLSLVTWHGHFWNASFLGALVRLFGNNKCPGYLGWHLPWLKNFLYPVFCLPILGYLMKSSARVKNIIDFDINYALFSVAMLIISPLGWIYYFSSLFLAYAILIHYSERVKQSSWIFFLAFLSLVMLNTPIIFKITSFYSYVTCIQTSHFTFHAFIYFLGISCLFLSLLKLNQNSKFKISSEIYCSWLCYSPLLIIGTLSFFFAYIQIVYDLSKTFFGLSL